jgi:hypothetical protein
MDKEAKKGIWYDVADEAGDKEQVVVDPDKVS